MHTVDLYRKVRLACRDGMSERAAARHFGISRESVKKMLQFSVPPGSVNAGSRFGQRAAQKTATPGEPGL